MTTTGAVMMTLAWLMLGRFALGPHRMSRSQLDRTLLLWALPLLIAPPPMYSRDVYSYLAQSQIARLGLDPYKVGPAPPGLGLDHVFTLSVPTIWRETPPAPYGPLFLWIGRGISTVTGENIVAAVLCHRVVVLLGVGLIVWATPPGWHGAAVSPRSAPVAGTVQPAAVHAPGRRYPQRSTDAGLMLAGTEFALRGIDGGVRDGSWRLAPRPLAMLVFGTVLIALSSQVKLPSLLAIGFVAMALAWRWGRHRQGLPGRRLLPRRLSLLVMAVIGWASGLGFGWLSTLGTANVVRSWMSPPTLIAWVPDRSASCSDWVTTPPRCWDSPVVSV